MSRLRRALALTLCSTSIALHAQTYTPQNIRVETPAGTDPNEPLRIAGLKPGPLTKEQIEAALQRIIDTGLFSDVSYTVSSAELVIKVTPAASSQALPVRYANFVWWQPGELEPLVEARLPVFHGSLPLAGTLTEQVEAVLIDLLQQKGVQAKVTAMQSNTAGAAIALSISSPPVTVSDLHLQNTLAALDPQLDKLRARLREEDFDIAETYASIHDSVADIYQKAGYLDVSTTRPAYGPPHKAMAGYAVDLSAEVQPGAMYRVSRFDVQTTPPLTVAQLTKVAEIEAGDPASPLALRIAKGEMEQEFRREGYFDAQSHIATAKDSGAHTVAYSVTFAPGEVYRFAALDTTRLTPEQQAAFAKDFHVAPGAVANRDLSAAISRILLDLHAVKAVSIEAKPDAAHHTVVIMLHPSATSH